MLSGNSTAGTRLTIHIDAADLPDTQIARADLAVELGTAIREVLANHEIDPDTLRCINGHAYTAIPAHCPVCDEPLHLTGFTLDASNGGHATAQCDCGWTGDAIYRLIDLHEHRDPTDDALIVDPEQVSSVHRHGVEPEYIPY